MRAIFRAERFRLRGAGEFSSKSGDRYGAFEIPTESGAVLRIIMDDGEQTGWEHVSVSLAARVPTWEEMCLVKDMFWKPDETVLQFHPRCSEYVNKHPNVLHLWRRRGVDHPLPPRALL